MRNKGEGRTMLGTPGFMAWEMFKEEYTQLVDIFAFGMCVLEMVTNEYPYAECNGNPTAYMKKGQEIVHPEALKDVKDEEIKDLIVKCLLPEAQRPTAEELMQHPFITRQIHVPQPSGRVPKKKNKSRNTMTKPVGVLTSPNSMNIAGQPGQQQQQSHGSSTEGLSNRELKQSTESVPSGTSSSATMPGGTSTGTSMPPSSSSSRPGSRRNSFEHPVNRVPPTSSSSSSVNPMSQSVPTAAYLPTGSNGEGESTSTSVFDSGYESGDRGGYDSSGNGKPRSYGRRDLMRPPSSYVHRGGGQSDVSSISSASAQPSSASSSAHASPSQLSNGIVQAPHSGGSAGGYGIGRGGIPPNGTFAHSNPELKLPLDSPGGLTAQQAYQLSAGTGGGPPLGGPTPASPLLGRSPSQSPPCSPRVARHVPHSPRRAPQDKGTFNEREGVSNLAANQHNVPPMRKTSSESEQSAAFHRMARSRSIDTAVPMSGDSFVAPFEPNVNVSMNPPPPTFAEVSCCFLGKVGS